MKIALDLGGTNVRAALVDGSECVRRVSAPCPATGTEAEVTDCITELISQIITPEVTAIGAGVPSVVDTARGIVYNVANIPSWREVHLGSLLTERFGVPAAVDNDVNCFVLGESLYGAAAGKRNVVGITLGTGIGAGLILNGQLYGGVLSGAGEIGSLPYLTSDYEHFCSSMFFRDIYGTTAGDMARRADEGDPEALQAWDVFGQHLGSFICAVLYAYAPECIVIGGGISESFGRFAPAMMRRVADSFPYPMIAGRCTVVQSCLRDANLIGAAALTAR